MIRTSNDYDFDLIWHVARNTLYPRRTREIFGQVYSFMYSFSEGRAEPEYRDYLWKIL